MIDELFKRGSIQMMISGGWNLERIPKDSPSLDFGVALIPKPQGGRNISFASAEIFVISKGSNIETAIKLAGYLLSPGNALRVASRVRSIQPAHRSAAVISATLRDGIDVSIVEIRGSYRQNKMKEVFSQRLSYPSEIHRWLLSLSERSTIEEIAGLDFLLGEAFANSVIQTSNYVR